MLIIRESQIQQFSDAMIRRFVSRLTDVVLDIWSSECEKFGLENINDIVNSAVIKAIEYSFYTENEISRFVHLVFILENPHFYKLQWVEPILTNYEITQKNRMNSLWNMVRQSYFKK